MKYRSWGWLLLTVACAGGPTGAPEEEIPAVEERFSLQGGAAAALEPTPASGTVPGTEAYFERLGLRIDQGQNQFIVGDNIAGYFEGFTRAYRKGQGYLMKDTVVFQSYAALVQGRLLDRTAPDLTETVQPYGWTAQSAGGERQTLVLHSGRYALSLRAESPDPASLTLVPMLALGYDDGTWRNAEPGVLLFEPHHVPGGSSPAYVALSTDRDAGATLGWTLLPEEARTRTGLVPFNLGLALTTVRPETRFTVHIAFGFSADEAVDKARRMADFDPIMETRNAHHARLTASYLETSDPTYNQALGWSLASAYSMVVTEFGKGIWAGLPWFKDNWGRDTFIALPGTLLVSGQFDEAREVLDNFARLQNRGQALLWAEVPEPTDQAKVRSWMQNRFPALRPELKAGRLELALNPAAVQDPTLGRQAQAEGQRALPGLEWGFEIRRTSDYGRVPNRVTSLDNIIYNTVDGTPWLIRELYEYAAYTGDLDFARRLFPLVREYIAGAREFYVDAEGLLTHADADTWMDAKIEGREPWSARGTRANDIQALWITALRVGALLAGLEGQAELARDWTALAGRAQESFLRRFWVNGVLADRLRADDSPDLRVRPNQLMVITIPFTPLAGPETEAAWVAAAVPKLVYPHGVASLNEEDPYFHPLHENSRFHHKDAAYHNGTIWHWNAGFVVSSLAKYRAQDLAWQLTRNLADQLLNRGTRGSLSENMNALANPDGTVALTGTYSQAWSVSEFARNGYQDYLGFKPDLVQGSLVLEPALPKDWTRLSARVAYGAGAALRAGYEAGRWTLELEGEARRDLVFRWDEGSGAVYEARLSLQAGRPLTLESAGTALRVDGRSQTGRLVRPSQAALLAGIGFRPLKVYRAEDWPMTRDRNLLRGIIQRGEYR